MLSLLKLFFTSKDFRKLVLLTIKNRFIEIVSYPFIWIKALWKTIELYRTTPNSWDRYVKLKEEEAEVQDLEKKEKFMEAQMGAAGKATLMTIIMFACLYSEDVVDYNREEQESEFEQYKEETLGFLDEMKSFGVDIPKDVIALINDSSIDMYDKPDDISNFGDTARKKILDIKF